MSLITKIVDYVMPPLPEETETMNDVPAQTEEPADGQEAPKQAAGNTLGIAVFEPCAFEESTEIIHAITDPDAAAFVNFRRMSHTDALRTFDRISGAALALKGEALMISEHVLYASGAHKLNREGV